MTGYEAKISSSTRELTLRERVKLKDTSDATRLDSVLDEGALILNIDVVAVIEVHNEKSENKDYNVYVILTKDGVKYTTGSESFYSSYKGIADEMGDEEYELMVYKKPSKNFTGKSFLTCSLL